MNKQTHIIQKCKIWQLRTQALMHEQKQVFQAIFYSHGAGIHVHSTRYMLFFLDYIMNIIYVVGIGFPW